MQVRDFLVAVFLFFNFTLGHALAFDKDSTDPEKLDGLNVSVEVVNMTPNNSRPAITGLLDSIKKAKSIQVGVLHLGTHVIETSTFATVPSEYEINHVAFTDGHLPNGKIERVPLSNDETVEKPIRPKKMLSMVQMVSIRFSGNGIVAALLIIAKGAGELGLLPVGRAIGNGIFQGAANSMILAKTGLVTSWSYTEGLNKANFFEDNRKMTLEEISRRSLWVSFPKRVLLTNIMVLLYKTYDWLWTGLHVDLYKIYQSLLTQTSQPGSIQFNKGSFSFDAMTEALIWLNLAPQIASAMMGLENGQKILPPKTTKKEHDNGYTLNVQAMVLGLAFAWGVTLLSGDVQKYLPFAGIKNYAIVYAMISGATTAWWYRNSFYTNPDQKSYPELMWAIAKSPIKSCKATLSFIGETLSFWKPMRGEKHG